MSRYFLTGATGFLGRQLAQQLLAREHEVVALCRNAAIESASGGLASLGVTVKQGDVLDRKSVCEAATGCEAAFHCAGKVSRESKDAEAMYRVHVDGTKVTLDALKEVGVRRVVIASTSGTIAVSDDPEQIADEGCDAPMEAIARWPYYRSKLYAERAALDRNDASFEVVSINPSLLLGPGDMRGSSTEDVRKVLEGKIPFSPAGGAAFVDVRDAAEAMILALDKGRGGQRYLVNAANMSLEDFMGRIARIGGVKAPGLRLPRTNVAFAGLSAELLGRAAKALNLDSPLDRISAEMAQYYWYCDPTLAKEQLGWSHRDPNETLADTVDDLRSRGVVWPT